MKTTHRKRTAAICILAASTILFAGSCTKMDEECDYKTNTTQKGIIIVNPDKIVK